MIDSVIENRIFLAVIISGLLSQIIKIIIHMHKEKRGFLLKDLITTGGMPSTHSSLVSSLFAVLLFETGLSTLTVISFVLFIIIVTDSMGVRRSVGEEGKILNKIIRRDHLRIAQKHLALGHEPIEVLAGISLGFFISTAIWLLV